MISRRSHLVAPGVTALTAAAVTSFGLYHCEWMVIDGVWPSLGSADFDERSFRLNDEANLDVMDREFATVLERTFDGDVAGARRATYGEWKNRPFGMKVADASAPLFRTHI